MQTQRPNAHDVRRIAVAACRETRTVARYLEGKPVRSTSAASIAAALVALGLTHLAPTVAPSNDTDRPGAA